MIERLLLAVILYSGICTSDTCNGILDNFLSPGPVKIPSATGKNFTVNEEFSIVCHSRRMDQGVIFIVRSHEYRQLYIQTSSQSTSDGGLYHVFEQTLVFHEPQVLYVQCIGQWVFEGFGSKITPRSDYITINIVAIETVTTSKEDLSIELIVSTSSSESSAFVSDSKQIVSQSTFSGDIRSSSYKSRSIISTDKASTNIPHLMNPTAEYIVETSLPPVTEMVLTTEIPPPSIHLYIIISLLSLLAGTSLVINLITLAYCYTKLCRKRQPEITKGIVSIKGVTNIYDNTDVNTNC